MSDLADHLKRISTQILEACPARSDGAGHCSHITKRTEISVTHGPHAPPGTLAPLEPTRRHEYVCCWCSATWTS